MLAKQRLWVARVLTFPPLREPQESLTSLEPSIERVLAPSQGRGGVVNRCPDFVSLTFFPCRD